MSIKHIDRYDPTNQCPNRIDVRSAADFKTRFPGSYNTIKKAYPTLSWLDILKDIGYEPARVTPDGYPILSV